jgi:hypothetical protein
MARGRLQGVVSLVPVVAVGGRFVAIEWEGPLLLTPSEAILKEEVRSRPRPWPAEGMVGRRLPHLRSLP